jgi:predicted DNA-binding transcriptional regulator AlpA
MNIEALVNLLADAVAEKIAARLPQPTPQPPIEAAWLDTRAAAAYLGMRPKTLAEWRERGEGPKFNRVGNRLVRYRRADLDAFASRRRA